MLDYYGAEAAPQLADLYVDPRITFPSIGTPEQIEERRDIALSMLLFSAVPKDRMFDQRTFIRKQSEQYSAYGRRMRILASRVVPDTPALPVAPPLDQRSPEDRQHRACEILLALENVENEPLTPGQEAALVNELCTLRPSFSAEMLVSYLAKDVQGLDRSRVEGAVVAIGDEAIPEVLRFLRTDLRTPEQLQEGLSVLVALCKTPENCRARLLEAAQIDEDGAKRFKDFDAHVPA